MEEIDGKTVLLCTSVDNLGIVKVATAVVPSSTSKCLNDTRRALTLKLGATAQLAAGYLVKSLYCVSTSPYQERDPCSEIQVNNFQFIFFKKARQFSYFPAC